MFNNDIASTKHFTTKVDGEAAYVQWCGLVGISTNQFSFTVKTGRLFAGKPVIFRITSWGAYENASGEFVVFVAYYATAPKHTMQYSWQIDEKGHVVGVPRQYGFIA